MKNVKLLMLLHLSIWVAVPFDNSEMEIKKNK